MVVLVVGLEVGLGVLGVLGVLLGVLLMKPRPWLEGAKGVRSAASSSAWCFWVVVGLGLVFLVGLVGLVIPGPEERRDEKDVVDFDGLVVVVLVLLGAGGGPPPPPPRRELIKAERLDRAMFMRFVSWSWSAGLMGTTGELEGAILGFI